MNILRSILREEAAGGAAAVVAAGGTTPPTGAAPVTPPVTPPVTAPVTPPVTTTTPGHWSSTWLKPDGTVDHTAYDRLPDNLKSLGPSLANAKTVDDVFSKLQNLSTLAGKKALAPLPADAPAEAITERNALLRQINGVPEKPEGYNITKPADMPDIAWNQKGTDALLAVAHKHNLSPAAVKEWADVAASNAKEQMATIQQDETAFWQQQDKVFKESLIKDGIPYDKATDMVGRAAKQFGMPEDSPLLKYAEVRLILQRAAVATMEPRTVTGEGAPPAGGQDLATLINGVVHDKTNPKYKIYWDGGHPQNKAVKQEVMTWQAELARQQKAAGGQKR